MLLGAYSTSISPESEECGVDFVLVLSHELTGKCKITGDNASFPGGDNDDFRLLGYDVGSLEKWNK
jgi:hypothetical protein